MGFFCEKALLPEATSPGPTRESERKLRYNPAAASESQRHSEFFMSSQLHLRQRIDAAAMGDHEAKSRPHRARRAYAFGRPMHANPRRDASCPGDDGQWLPSVFPVDNPRSTVSKAINHPSFSVKAIVQKFAFNELNVL
jgi:hypothetical protein